MSGQPLVRDTLSPNRYSYLSEGDSVMYGLAAAETMTLQEACAAIKMLLEDKAAASRGAHARSTY